MQISESEEGSSAPESPTHLGKLTKVLVYIGKNPKQ